VAEMSRYVCVDWGTSQLRAALCEFDGNESIAHETLRGPGIKAARHSVEKTLFTVIAPWIREYGELPILLSGGVGSNIGWRATKYLACPLAVAEITHHCTTFSTRGCDIVIVPGVECTNCYGVTDTMRGEELQVLGWLKAEPSRLLGMHLVCLPGTHTKWVLVEDGRISKFQTAVTGEMYALMLEHSILLAQNGASDPTISEREDGFSLGIETCREAKGVLSHVLFSARSRLLKQELSAHAAVSYLSGMLIAADVMGAVELLRPLSDHVCLVGEPALCERFSTVLQAFGLDSSIMDGNTAAMQGFSVVYRDMYQPDQNRSASA